MVQFNGGPACTFTPAQMQTNMFGGGASGPGGRDLDDYFNEISYGDLQFVGTVVGDNGGTAACVPLAQNRAFYNNNVTNPDGDDDLVREALADIDPNIDFGDYDNDNDGQIDALGIIYAGGGAHDVCVTGANTDNLWPHSGGVGGGQGVDPAPDSNPKTVNPFIINSELTYSLSDPGLANNPITPTCNQIQTIGLFAHELGHSLGLPDLYDTDVGNGGVNSWSTMASQYLGTTNNADTPPHYDPWSKWHQGWITPTEHAATPAFRRGHRTGRGQRRGAPVPRRTRTASTGSWGTRRPRAPGSTSWSRTGSSSASTPSSSAAGSSSGTSTSRRPATRTAATPRDRTGWSTSTRRTGSPSSTRTRLPDNGDPFPGSTNNRLFDGTTNPNSDLYNGNDSGVRMWVQSTACAANMSAAFGPNQAPTADAGGPYSTPEGTSEAADRSGLERPRR